MKFKTKCPSCEGDIGVITIVAALSPFSFKCFKCKTLVRIRGIYKLMFVNFVVTGLCAVFTLQYLISSGVLEKGEYSSLLIPVFIIFCMEFIRALLVCNKASLTIKVKEDEDESGEDEKTES